MRWICALSLSLFSYKQQHVTPAQTKLLSELLRHLKQRISGEVEWAEVPLAEGVVLYLLQADTKEAVAKRAGKVSCHQVCPSSLSLSLSLYQPLSHASFDSDDCTHGCFYSGLHFSSAQCSKEVWPTYLVNCFFFFLFLHPQTTFGLTVD